MKITTAWIWPAGEDSPWMVSAYDELTADEWNGEPDFFTADVAKATAHDDPWAVRIIEIEVPSDAVYRAWDTPTVQGSVVDAGPPPTTRNAK